MGEFLNKDGSIVKGFLFLDADFDGEDEYPMPSVIVPDIGGESLSFFDFTHWRLVK